MKCSEYLPSLLEYFEKAKIKLKINQKNFQILAVTKCRTLCRYVLAYSSYTIETAFHRKHFERFP